MAQDRAKQLLQQGIAAAKAGQKNQAFQILQQMVKIDPHNETAWLWLSSVARNDQERIFCLRQLLGINPQNELAIKGLKAYGIEPAPPEQEEQQQKTAAPQANVPVVSKETLMKIQPALDDFLRGYNPAPYTPLEIEWVHKEKRRYGEGAARRLRTSIYAAAALGVAAVLVLALVLGGSVLDALRGDATEQVRRAEVIISLTPTNTLIPTQNPNTPVPEDLQENALVFPTPVGLRPGDAAAVNPTATIVYPRFSGAGSSMNTAVAFFSVSDYEQVSEISESIRVSQSLHCYEETYYYDAVGMAMSGRRSDLDAAERLLRDALAAERPQGTNSCQESALLTAGLCFVKYQRGLNINPAELGSAAVDCEAALATDPAIVQAADTLAKIYLEQGNLDGARRVLEDALEANERNAGNLILLLGLADIELALGDPDAALVYVSTALYVDPVSELALQKRVVAYLSLAEEATRPERRIVRYGTAATFAEYYLEFYPGSAMGHALLAEARLREGNPDQALYLLNKLIDSQNTLDDANRDTEALQRAYALRVEIYTGRRDWDKAGEDLDTLIALDQGNAAQWATTQIEIALNTGDYATAHAIYVQLRAEAPNQIDLLLQEVFTWRQACLFGARCPRNDYNTASYEAVVINELLTEEILASLDADSPEYADALFYRVEAEFIAFSKEKLGIDDAANGPDLFDFDLESLTDEDAATLDSMLERMQGVAAIRETADTYYLLGRIYIMTGQQPAALQVYEWLAYWGQSYDYPFAADVSWTYDRLQEGLAEA